MDRNGEQLLIEAVWHAERAAINLRDYAVCAAMRDFPRVWRAAGDVTGAVAFLSSDHKQSATELQRSLVTAAAQFLGRQVE